MILYVLKQNKNRKSPAFGKWFAFPVIEETIDLDALAEHMSNHNTPYSKGAIKGCSPTWCRASRNCCWRART